MPERIKDFINYLPFLALMVTPPRPQPLVTKLVETAIMSCVAAAFATYIGVELLKVEIANIKAAIKDVEVHLEAVDRKIEKVREDLYVPRGMR